MRKTTVVVLALAVLVIAAGSFGAGWVVRGRSDDGLRGSCIPADNPPTDLVCSSNDAVLAHEQEHSLVCYRVDEFGTGGRGVYRCREARE